MSILFLILSLFGCQKAALPAKHELSEITAVSISCANIDRSYSYSFFVHKEENIWLFDAKCFTHNYETETVLNGYELGGNDAKILLEILEQNGSIAYVENYKKPKNLPVQVADDTTYAFCLTFLDKKQYVTYDRQSDLEEFFYDLAKKYDEAISK